MNKKSTSGRCLIVGAGASFPYGLPLAGGLLDDAVSRVAALGGRWHDARRKPFFNRETITRGDRLDDLLLETIEIGPHTLDSVVGVFREDLVHMNLDDFVRDHESLTAVVSILIATKLFSSMYTKEDGDWYLNKKLTKGGMQLSQDWMRRFVGVMRPLLSEDSTLKVVSFNYDSLLERAVHLYWPGSEYAYLSHDKAIEFIYPHGKFSELPHHVTSGSVKHYLKAQAAQLRIGKNIDQEARDRAKAAVAQSLSKFSVGFSFSDSNLALLGINKSTSPHFFVQNYNGEDKRLERKLNQLLIPPAHRETGGMDDLIVRGFFEQ